MGSSWVGLDEKIPEEKQNEWLGVSYGFWVKDGPLWAWLCSMGEMVDEWPDAPTWLKDMRAEWRDAYCGAGCVFTGFKTHITNHDRRSVMLDLTLRTLQRLLDFEGDYQRAFKSTIVDPFDPTNTASSPPRIGEKIGLIEVGSNVARVLCSSLNAGEHSPTRWGYAPDTHWLKPT